MKAVTRYYFDHNATTPVSPEVFQAMAPLMTTVFGNASSIHQFGQEARGELDRGRRSGAAIFGAGGHIVTTTVEHPAVLQASQQLPEATFVSVDSRGVVDPEAVRASIR